MSCQEHSEELLHRYLDEEMSVAERTDFEAHLAACERCLTHFTEVGSTIQRLEGGEWHKAPAGFTESVLAKLEHVAPPRRNWRVPIMKYSGIAAAVLLVFGLGASFATPEEFALQANHTDGLIITDGKVIVPEGSEYNGDLVIQNGDIEVRGKVNGNVTALNGQVHLARSAGADISGEVAEVDEAFEKIGYYLKEIFRDLFGKGR
ncbi:anti-sigma factor RsiW [Tumebacillus sp. BK434]|uniref:zf-HC2 domain-containing protein n=1 Tax=Tumebacillus sp. BK434 TaxID=2512169 RepID=UPI0010D99501|nr:zf-HC2 domain-containing protein [Tumebacillus sp. BK434]TCP57862.1 anti-sigma factor RsiW [Tumebacillus sp. BK434]